VRSSLDFDVSDPSSGSSLFLVSMMCHLVIGPINSPRRLFMRDNPHQSSSRFLRVSATITAITAVLISFLKNLREMLIFI